LALRNTEVMVEKRRIELPASALHRSPRCDRSVACARERSDSLQRQRVDGSGLSADGLESVAPAVGKRLAGFEKMSERDVKEAIDKRIQGIRHGATRASTSEH